MGHKRYQVLVLVLLLAALAVPVASAEVLGNVTPEPTTEPTTVPTTIPTTVPTTVKTTEPTTLPTTLPTTNPTLIGPQPGSGKGWIRVNCNVDGATVSFDQQSAGCTIASGWCSVEVGTTWTPYTTYTVQKSGYQTYTGPVTSWPAEGQTVNLYATLNPVPPSSGSISVTTSPAGAGVYINGVLMGYAPYTAQNLNPQTYTVMAKLDGYTPSSQTVTVYAGQTTPVYFTLSPSPPAPRPTGTLSITSIPSGAQAYTDGTYRGITPVTVTQYPGTHTVLVQKSGYADFTQTAYVNANQQTAVYAQLASSAAGWITIQSSPGYANIYLDSNPRGQTDANGALTISGVSPGSHTFKATYPGYNDYITTVTVNPNAQTYIPVTLVPRGAQPTPVPATGGVSIASTPTGADVYIDNVFRGYTPMTLTDLTPGQHTVLLKSAGYQDYQTTIQIQSGSSIPLAASLTPVPTPTKSGASVPFAALGALGIFAFLLVRKGGF